jgi:hypothetical protein
MKKLKMKLPIHPKHKICPASFSCLRERERERERGLEEADQLTSEM